jgi:Holliday junction resolvase RusA-like endonuclease
VIVSFFVPGRPMGTQTGELVGKPRVMLQTPVGQVEIQKAQMFPKRHGQEWTRTVKLHALKHRPRRLLEGPVRAEFRYVFEPPEREPAGGLPSIPLHVDCGNLTKGILDALEGVLLPDDAWVADEINQKRWGQHGGVNITLSSAPEFVL